MSLSATAQGCALIETRRELEQSEVAWLGELADFVECELFRDDGHVSAAAWLVERCGLARATAFEKLRVAREITKRPALRDALVDGAVSYSQVRAITRITDGGPEYDELMLSNAPKLTADELEQAAAHWDRIRNQDKPPPDFSERRRITRTRGFGGGMGRVIIDDWDESLDRLLNCLDAAVDGNERAAAKALAESSAQSSGESSAETPLDGFAPGDESDAGDIPPTPTLNAKRLDALNDLIEIAVAVNPETIDVERATVGVTVSYENLVAQTGDASLSRGGTITGEAARRLACDAGLFRIVTRGKSEVLDLGRLTRNWNRAQRRAAKALFKHKCAIKGCDRRIVEIHHVFWWEDGGITSIEVAVPLCHSHHVLVHEGHWQLDYDYKKGEVRLTAPGLKPFTSYVAFDSAA